MIRSLGQIRQEYPLLDTPLRKDRWVCAHAVSRGESSYLELSNAEDTVFIAATTPLLLTLARTGGGADSAPPSVFSQ